MTRLKHYIVNYNLDEAAYDGNIGFSELTLFYQKANRSDISKMEKTIKDEDWDGFKRLIYNILNITLK